MIEAKFFFNYIKQVNDAASFIDETQVEKAYKFLLNCYRFNNQIFVIGNGGSASLSQHFSCDHTKGICHDTPMKTNVVSLAANMALITAIANDYDYEQIFSKQVEYSHREGEVQVLVAISASGNSPNIINAINKAYDLGWLVLAFVGFDGGKIVKDQLTDYVVHVPSHNYGVVEDVHQMIMHSISQKIRMDLTEDKSNIKL